MCVCAHTHTHTLYIYIYKLTDHSWGLPKGSLNQYLLCRNVGESATPFSGLLHFTLDLYFIMLNVKQEAIKYDFLSFWHDLTWDWTLVSQTIDEYSTHYTNKPVIYIYIHTHTHFSVKNDAVMWYILTQTTLLGFSSHFFLFLLALPCYLPIRGERKDCFLTFLKALSICLRFDLVPVSPFPTETTVTPNTRKIL